MKPLNVKSRKSVNEEDSFDYSNQQGQELIIREPYKEDESPLVIITLTDKNEVFGVIGNERVTPIYPIDQKLTLIQELDKTNWEIMVNIISSIVRHINTFEKQQAIINENQKQQG